MAQASPAPNMGADGSRVADIRVPRLDRSPVLQTEGRAGLDLLGAAGVVKFGLLVGLGAIFYDAVLAHGLMWENDPYWTYWITKTFLQRLAPGLMVLSSLEDEGVLRGSAGTGGAGGGDRDAA